MLVLPEELTGREDDLGRKRRREWSIAEKRRIVAEANQPDANKSAIARRYGISDSQLYAWRKGLGSEADAHFLPVVTDEPPLANSDGSPGSIDIVLSNGHRLTISGAVDPAHVKRLLRTLAST